MQRTSADYPSAAELQAAGYTIDGVNQFAVEVEHALVKTAVALDQANNEITAIRGLMTNPDRLSQYTLEFFGPNGPYPIEEARAARAQRDQMAQQAQYQQQMQMQQQQPQMPGFMDPRVRPDGSGLDSSYARQVDPIGVARPNFPAPPVGQTATPRDLQVLGQVFSQNPQNAYEIIDQLERSGAFRGAVLAVDS
ncbi:hypothetical protein [Nodosilinea nodulosa]|uniref:hypothetical protein n=1 Tax=Nodosilinea nodulosa TaxID=416001 RepID=UPI00030CF872|nr:hypothetical protein [Nodosilinea nodulosa]